MILRIVQSAISNILTNIFFLIFGFSSLSGVSQSLKIINLEEIHQKKVRQYILSRSIDTMQNFSSIHASCKKDINESNYKINEKTFYLKYSFSKVWECYSIGNPLKTWNGPCIGLGLLITKSSKSVRYAQSSIFPEIDTGQVYFLNLRLLKGLINLPVAFEVINIDRIRHIVEISYLDDNKSRGKQTIQFFDNGVGRTMIVHRSYFKSESWFRDDLFYPYFHKKFIKEFHRNMEQYIKTSILTASLKNK
jgi:hypothetical protein